MDLIGVGPHLLPKDLLYLLFVSGRTGSIYDLFKNA
jgi:hypothetical protein